MLEAEEIHRAIETAPRGGLDAIARVLWAAVVSGQITETEAEGLSGLIDARRIIPAVPAAPRRRVGSRPRTDASMERRRRWAASGWLPPALAARYTPGEQAVLSVVSDQVWRHGRCTLAVGNIAALAGVSDSTVDRAMRQARAQGIIWVQERRSSHTRNDTNIVTIISLEWRAWLDRRSRGGGGQTGRTTNTKALNPDMSRMGTTVSRAFGRRKRTPRSQLDRPPGQTAVES